MHAPPTTRAARRQRQANALADLRKKELPLLFDAIGIDGACRLACTCQDWRDAVEASRTVAVDLGEPVWGIDLTRIDLAEAKSEEAFLLRFVTKVLPRFSNLRTLDLLPWLPCTCGPTLNLSAWPRLQVLSFGLNSETALAFTGVSLPCLRELEAWRPIFMERIDNFDKLLRSILKDFQQLRHVFIGDRRVTSAERIASQRVAGHADAVPSQQGRGAAGSAGGGIGGIICPVLEQLHVVGCEELESVTLTAAPRLRRASFDHCENILSGAIIDMARASPQLESLSVKDCRLVEAAAAAALCGCPRLARLDVRGATCMLSTACLNILLKAPALTRLDLTHSHTLPERAILDAGACHPQVQYSPPLQLGLTGIETVFYKVSPSKRLRKLMHHFCNRHALCMDWVHFSFKGRLLVQNETPEELGMVDGDSILTVLDANVRAGRGGTIVTV